MVGESDKKYFIENKQRHLPGPLGYFNPEGLADSVYLCESPIDALSLLTMQRVAPWALHGNVSSIFGINGSKPGHMPASVIFAFDNPEQDKASRKRYKKLTEECLKEGIRFGFADSSYYGGCKDLNEALVKQCGIFNIDQLALDNPEMYN
jgi:hypothetical protein